MRNLKSFQAIHLIFYKENTTWVVQLNLQEDQEGQQEQPPVHYRW